MAKRINEMEAKFIAFYLADPAQNATEAARKAGYSPKSCGQIGWQLVNRPKIKEELDKQLALRREEISKETFVDMAIKDYKALEITEANKPRFLDIAGKALGYIGANSEQRPNQTLNVLNINLTGKESRDELLANVRKLLRDNSGQA